jgi:crossover junction endodeoxyribonuclease RusA
MAKAVAITLPWPDKLLWPRSRPHWAVKARVTSVAKALAFYTAKANKPTLYGSSELVVKVVGNAPSKRSYDGDNLQAACKAYFDGIAAAIGIDDKHWRFDGVTKGDPVKGGQVVIIIAPIDPEAMARAA